MRVANFVARDLLTAGSLGELVAKMREHRDMAYLVATREGRPFPFVFRSGCKFDERGAFSRGAAADALCGPCDAASANAARFAEDPDARPIACTLEPRECFKTQQYTYFAAWMFLCYAGFAAAHVAAKAGAARLGAWADAVDDAARVKRAMRIDTDTDSTKEAKEEKEVPVDVRVGARFVRAARPVRAAVPELPRPFRDVDRVDRGDAQLQPHGGDRAHGWFDVRVPESGVVGRELRGERVQTTQAMDVKDASAMVSIKLKRIRRIRRLVFETLDDVSVKSRRVDGGLARAQPRLRCSHGELLVPRSGAPPRPPSPSRAPPRASRAPRARRSTPSKRRHGLAVGGVAKGEESRRLARRRYVDSCAAPSSFGSSRRAIAVTSASASYDTESFTMSRTFVSTSGRTSRAYASNRSARGGACETSSNAASRTRRTIRRLERRVPEKRAQRVRDRVDGRGVHPSERRRGPARARVWATLPFVRSTVGCERQKPDFGPDLIPRVEMPADFR